MKLDYHIWDFRLGNGKRRNLFECQRCGAMVADKDLHDTVHPSAPVEPVLCATCGKSIDPDHVRYLDGDGRQTHLTCDPDSRDTWMFKGRVTDAGGGVVDIMVDRDTDSYPIKGQRVEVLVHTESTVGPGVEQQEANGPAGGEPGDGASDQSPSATRAPARSAPDLTPEEQSREDGLYGHVVDTTPDVTPDVPIGPESLPVCERAAWEQGYKAALLAGDSAGSTVLDSLKDDLAWALDQIDTRAWDRGNVHQFSGMLRAKWGLSPDSNTGDQS